MKWETAHPLGAIGKAFVGLCESAALLRVTRLDTHSIGHQNYHQREFQRHLL